MTSTFLSTVPITVPEAEEEETEYVFPVCRQEKRILPPPARRLRRRRGGGDGDGAVGDGDGKWFKNIGFLFPPVIS